ncbi:MAG: hypothetical protein PHO67_08225 [Candidatus Omnitrophica bacterium]|nr:hypothetical protein [Candidatus Omnitrophota bacterium]
MNNHTPGPWKTGRTDIQSYTGDGIQEMYVYRDPNAPIQILGNNCHADARLIAAAPDMFAALTDLRQWCLNRAQDFALLSVRRRIYLELSEKLNVAIVKVTEATK